MTSSRFEVELEPKVKKALLKLEKSHQARVLAALKLLKTNPRPRHAKQMVGFEQFWRIRVGDYRIVYTIHDQKLIILVVRIAHRRDVYRVMG